MKLNTEVDTLENTEGRRETKMWFILLQRSFYTEVDTLEGAEAKGIQKVVYFEVVVVYQTFNNLLSLRIIVEKRILILLCSFPLRGRWRIKGE